MTITQMYTWLKEQEAMNEDKIAIMTTEHFYSEDFRTLPVTTEHLTEMKLDENEFKKWFGFYEQASEEGYYKKIERNYGTCFEKQTDCNHLICVTFRYTI